MADCLRKDDAHMKWEHKCSLEWMTARQNCLTASDVKELLPYTATGRPRKIGNEQYIKVLARKKAQLSDDDTLSLGAAARGHILEPEAIKFYNEERDPAVYPMLYHWDDLVVSRYKRYELGFSPDAMDIRPPFALGPRINFDNIEPHTIGEIKCYSPERHLLCGTTTPMKLEERWQVAVAMAVCPSVEYGILLFYNPSMEKQMFCVSYSRYDLKDEIEKVREVEEAWKDWLGAPSFWNPMFLGNKSAELRIIEELEARARLNP